ncbi:MAG: hypothetical protein HKN35_13425 [Woeseia sp.]|nr:hypothetical protein [Woeseia sp.]MBT8096878.1 hypothetical protein [Woeseia sp.]NNE61890.1 hypothetical protein [Woeseia sp.]NNL56048.1 hypothetical protein [Woeseia sp.]
MTVARNILAFLLGLVVGSGVNMSLLMIGHRVIRVPAGVDTSTMEGLASSMHLFGPEQFLFPFLAHALGTLAGALLGYVIAGSRRRWLAYAVGTAFLFGGIANVIMLPAPAWFNAVDLLLAYVPMAWLACVLGSRLVKDDATDRQITA